VPRLDFDDNKMLAANDVNLPRNNAWAVQEGQAATQQQLQLNSTENALRSRAVTAQAEEAIKQQPMIKMKEPPAKILPKAVAAAPKPSAKPAEKKIDAEMDKAELRQMPRPPQLQRLPAAGCRVQRAAQDGFGASRAEGAKENLSALKSEVASTSSRPFQGVWLGKHLVLTREAVVDGVRMVQGVWLDWPALREAWLKEITDLFPDAHLEPAANVSLGTRPTDDPLRFAALPVRLVAGVIQLPPLPFWTPLRKSLAIALACVLLAAAAVGLVLHGTVALSERRADFVSAVTHELRTPLTTFRLYSEMLADGMVTDEAQRKTYLDTLTGEAGRLSHLVENVLAYARLERGSAKARAENVTIGELLDRILPRLKQRADDCGMEVRVHATEADRKTQLHIDAAAVEQILFNLVDNACKYAAPRAAEPVIHVEADTSGKFAMLRVRDHGGGISRSERRRIFHPFHKSADQAAHSAPGVGLGLALCRRLATALGGAITLDAAHKDGACFVLSLPK
jgi:signal transduction histidine kinase